MKKAIWRSLLVFLGLLLSFPVWIWFAAPVIDNIALSAFRADVLRDIPHKSVVESVSGCGNTSGTGNHTELYVAVLIQGESLSSLSSARKGISQTREMELLGLSFSPENITEHTYIIDACISAPCSWLDIRGH